MKRIEASEEKTIHDGLRTTGNPMDYTQYNALIGYLKSIVRILIYILATLFGGLCYAIGKLEHLSGFWLFVYPAIFVFLAFSEIHVARKKHRKSREHMTIRDTHTDKL